MNTVYPFLRSLPGTPGEYPATNDQEQARALPAPPEDGPGSFLVHTQLPANTWKTSWTQVDVDHALQLHDSGQFASASMLMEAMSRDDAVDAVVSARVDGMLGLERDIEAATQGHKGGGKRIAKDIAARFDEFFPQHVLAQLKRTEIYMGFAVAQIVWRADEDANEWVPTIEPWHPLFVYVETMSQTYYALTTQGPVPILEGTGQWLLYAPHGRVNGWKAGAIRSLATPWLARQYAWRDWVRWSELYSLGIRKAKFPANADATVKRRFFAQVASLGGNTTVGLEQADDGKAGFDIEVLFPESAGTAEGFDKLMTKAETKIAIRINGQNLTTEVSGGSYAAAFVHENVKHDIIAADSKSLGECLARDVVVPFITWHDYPEKTAPPSIGWDVDPPEDSKARAETLGALGTALIALGQAHIPLSIPEIMEQYDLPVAETPEDMLQPPVMPVAAAPAGAPQGAPGDGAPSPAEGGTPFDAPAPQGGAPSPPAPVPRNPDPTMNSVSLAAGLRRGRAPLEYADRVVDSALELGRAAVKPYLAKVLASIEAGESFEDVRKRVLAAYREHEGNPELVLALHRAQVLSSAAGALGARHKAKP